MSRAARPARAAHRARRRAAARVAAVSRGRRWPTVALASAVVVVLAALGWLLWPTTTVDHTPAEATVIESSECGGATAGRDVVRFEFGGRSVRAMLDGCGNRPGAQLDIEVPGTMVHDGMTVRLAGTGVSDTAVTTRRVAAVLLVVAAAAGALLAWYLARHGGTRGRTAPR